MIFISIDDVFNPKLQGLAMMPTCDNLLSKTAILGVYLSEALASMRLNPPKAFPSSFLREPMSNSTKINSVRCFGSESMTSLISKEYTTSAPSSY